MSAHSGEKHSDHKFGAAVLVYAKAPIACPPLLLYNVNTEGLVSKNINNSYNSIAKKQSN